MNLQSVPNLFGSNTGAVAGCGACSGGAYKKKSKRKTKRGGYKKKSNTRKRKKTRGGAYKKLIPKCKSRKNH
jgi:hypothetical protein